MLISHKHKFIFFHVNKTGGSSFELGNITKYFSNECIITPHEDFEEANMRRQFSNKKPQNFKAKKPFSIAELSFMKNKIAHLYFLRFKSLSIDFSNVLPVRFKPHTPAKQAKQIIPEKIWKSNFKFCFTRNPFDKIISLITWKMQNKLGPESRYKEKSFFSLTPELVEKEICKGMAANCHESSWGMYTENDEIIVDRVYMYEDIENALKDIREKIDFPEDIKMAKSKNLARNRLQRVGELYTDLSRKIVERVCEKELNLFHYTFENAKCASASHFNEE